MNQFKPTVEDEFVAGADPGPVLYRETSGRYGRDFIQVQSPPAIQSLRELLGDRYTPDIEWGWPDVAPPIFPCGINILVQLKVPTRKTASGLILADETMDANKVRSQTALVRALGPVAFKRRDTLAPWPEGAWCQPGTFIRTPMYGGDRLEVAIPGREKADTALFVTFKDMDCLSVVIGDPLGIKTS